MDASSNVSMSPVPSVKRTPPAPGRTSGNRWVFSRRSCAGVVNTSISPPSADTRARPTLLSGAKTIRSSSPQLAPRTLPTSATVVSAPPVIGTFMSPSRMRNPSHRPSGEKKGIDAPSVPSTSCASISSKRRRYSCVVLSRNATNATRSPSGEIADAVVRSIASSAPAGSGIAARTFGVDSPERRPSTLQTATATATIATRTASREVRCSPASFRSRGRSSPVPSSSSMRASPMAWSRRCGSLRRHF